MGGGVGGGNKIRSRVVVELDIASRLVCVYSRSKMCMYNYNSNST